MSTAGLTSHGTLVARAPAATPTVFTTIAELLDINPPEVSRPETDTTSQNDDIDSYVYGAMKRTPLTFNLNFVPGDATQDHLNGLYSAIKNKTTDGYKVTFIDGTVWIMSGQLQKLTPKAPNQGKLEVAVTIRPSGKFTINGTVFG